MKTPQNLADESAISEISIAADGRMYVFGATQELLEVMAVLNDRDAALRQRIEHGRAIVPGTGKLSTPGRATRPCDAVEMRHSRVNGSVP